MDMVVSVRGNPVIYVWPVPAMQSTWRRGSELRDTENVPFTYGGNSDGAGGGDATISAYFEHEIQPHVPDAWLDASKTKVGYEIPFTRIFYRYQPPRTLEEIDADLESRVARVLDLLREVER